MIRFGNVTIDANNRTISNGSRSRQWNNNVNDSRGTLVQFRLVKHLLLCQGITADQMFDALYGHREDGGPLDDHVVHIHMVQLKPVFEHLNLTLKVRRHLSRCVYRLVANA